MKKRITSLLLAVLMTFAIVSTTAVAVADDAEIMPLATGCPRCENGTIRTRFVTEVPGVVVKGETLTVCYCGAGRYNCYETKREYDQTYQTGCDRCTFIKGTEHRTAIKSEWRHYGCVGSGCGH